MGIGDMFNKLLKKDSSEEHENMEKMSSGALTDDPKTEDINQAETPDIKADSSSSDSNDVGGEEQSKQTATPDTVESGGTQGGQVSEQTILEVLSNVYDPEIPIDIVNLGLIYGIEINGTNVTINMTMTAPGCPASGQIASESKFVVEELKGVDNVNIELVWDPPWDPSKMSEEAQQSMGMF